MSVVFAMLFILASCGEKQSGGYKLVWEENFENSSKLEEGWFKIPRGKKDWDKYMSDYDGLYSIKSGNLILKGVKNTVLPEDESPYLTGGVYSKQKMGHGRIEVRAKLFGARSVWSTIKLIPKLDNWPHGGEIDIMERLNDDNYIYQTIHSDYTLNQGMKDEPKSAIAAYIKPDNYNVYAVEIYADSVNFFVNDTHTFTYPRIETDRSGQFPFGETEFHLLINLQLGGRGVGDVNEQDLPAQMHIDWVRFMELKE